MQNGKQLNDLGAKKHAATESQDLAKLFHYPSVGELFSENNTRRLDEFCLKLSATRENLERIVRYGNRDEADRALRAVRGIEVTLDFLQSLQDLRLKSEQ